MDLPNLPIKLRDYQVRFASLNFGLGFSIKIDIVTAITDSEENRHVLAALPTGSGKTLPQLLVPSLVIPG